MVVSSFRRLGYPPPRSCACALNNKDNRACGRLAVQERGMMWPSCIFMERGNRYSAWKSDKEMKKNLMSIATSAMLST